jgi:hypothetical protein
MKNIHLAVIMAVILVVIALIAIVAMPKQGNPSNIYTTPASQMIVSSNDMGEGWSGGYIHPAGFIPFNITASDNSTVQFQNKINNQSVIVSYLMLKFATVDMAKDAHGSYYSSLSEQGTMQDLGIGDKSLRFTNYVSYPSLITDRIVFVKGNVFVDISISNYSVYSYSSTIVQLSDLQVLAFVHMQEVKIV